MYNVFYKYLITNRKVGLPGLGNFYWNSLPAKADLVNGTLKAPQGVVHFNTDIVHADKTFYTLLQKELQLTELGSIDKVNEFSLQLKQAATNTNGITLPGLGILRTGYDGTLYFTSDKRYDHPWQDVDLNTTSLVTSKILEVYDSGETKIITQDVQADPEEKIKMHQREDYWWVYAIVLAIMGLGALLYYYI